MLISGSLPRLGLLLTLALAASPVRAADRGGVRELGEEVAGLQAQAEDIRRNFTERSGLIGVTEARERFEDALYLYLVKDYESAAMSFYILVQSRALGNEDLARDSEWYLAECLFELGNYRTAEEAYRYIAEKGSTHPYFGDAIRRLLEAYGILGDTERFDRYYNDFIVSGKVPATELINYTLAKSFYRRGEYNRSKAMFDSLPATSPYYGRARYFLGVLMIQEKNYPQAIAEYQTVAALTVTDPAQEQVRELAQLALARLYYETGDFAQASTWYGKIGGNSTQYADQLYESVWTLIKQANSAETPELARPRWKDALTQVGIFLDAYPEHRYTASLRILQGHLHMKIASYEDARVSYERVVDEYTPIIARLRAVERQDQLRRLLEGVSGGDAALSERLPPFAMGALASNVDVARAAAAWREVEEQRTALAESERIAKDLELALSGGSNVLGGFVVARQEVAGIRGATLSVRDRLLEAEGAWLRTRVPTQYRAELAQIQKDRAAVLASLSEIEASSEASSDRVQVYEEQVREVQQRAFRLAQEAQDAKALAGSTAEQVGQSKLSLEKADAVRAEIVKEQRELDTVLRELETLQGEVTRRRVMRTVDAPATSDDGGRRATLVARYDDLRRKLQGYRSYVTDPEANTFYTQVDGVWGSIGGLEAAAEGAGRVLASSESREIAAVRARLARETQRVTELRREVATGAAEAESIATRAVRYGIRSLEDDLRSDVLEADKGIVDVYWLRKTAASDQMTELGAEQARLLRELDDQFRIVRENLDR